VFLTGTATPASGRFVFRVESAKTAVESKLDRVYRLLMFVVAEVLSIHRPCCCIKKYSCSVGDAAVPVGGAVRSVSVGGEGGWRGSWCCRRKAAGGDISVSADSRDRLDR
jgi:hypothetical protein